MWRVCAWANLVKFQTRFEPGPREHYGGECEEEESLIANVGVKDTPVVKMMCSERKECKSRRRI